MALNAGTVQGHVCRRLGGTRKELDYSSSRHQLTPQVVLGMFWACFGHVFSVFLHHTSSSLEKLEIARASQLANSIGRWIPARVLGVTPSGNFNLDCKWSTQKLQTQPWSFESVDSAHGSLAKMYLLISALIYSQSGRT